MFTKIITAFAFSILTLPAFAGTAPDVNLDELNKYVQENTQQAPVVCANGAPTWEEGKADFYAFIEANKLDLIGEFIGEDKSLTVFVDTRNAEGYAGNKDFIYTIVFAPNGCFVTSFSITEQILQDNYGITLASN